MEGDKDESIEFNGSNDTRIKCLWLHVVFLKKKNELLGDWEGKNTWAI